MTNLTAERTASTPNTTSKVVLVSGPGPGDAAMMLGDLRIEELAAQRFEAFEGAFLIRPISRE